MRNNLSILIPTYNDQCTELVRVLAAQLHSMGNDIRWEIIVADDGSYDEEVLRKNREIGNIDGCKFIERKQNCGRAAIRNFLASQAQHDTLLYIDSDMTIVRNDFVKKYLTSDAPVVYGGYVVTGKDDSLRYRYEKACEKYHTAEYRRRTPYKDFHTSNYMIEKAIIKVHPLDERFTKYGYEDVLYGKQLQDAGIEIVHIDNPTGFATFESNAEFIRKTDEAIATLLQFKHELSGYSRLLAMKERMEKAHIAGFVRAIGKCIIPILRKNLCHKNGASLWQLRLYKIFKIA
ncbi:MAG: glycosyltransferase family 2 protein [Prevotella sp.]|nr:glycosyltransferase family 2 protein [Prevotella sp.]